MPTNTPNLDLILPTEGGSNDVWGGNLNTDLAKIDAKFNPTGPNVVVQTNAEGYIAGKNMALDDATATFRLVFMRTAAVNRWAMGTDNVAEGIGDIGSDFVLYRYANDGSSLDTTFPTILSKRSTGVVQFGKTPQVMVAGVANDIIHTGNITTSLASVTEPVGTIKMYAGAQVGSTDPSEFYFFCNGRSLPKSDYPALFNAIGATYGASADGLAFHLPNTAARVIIGLAGGIPLDFPPTYDVSQLGKSFGVGTHTLTIPEMPNHNHNLQDPKHAHDFQWHQNAGAAGSGTVSFNSGDVVTPGGVAPGVAGIANHSTGITIDAVGGGLAHDNIQPSLVLNFIIRVK